MYNDVMSVKYQITLPEDLATEMKSVAARLHMPLAQFIRETVEERLHQAKSGTAPDPFNSITGLVDTSEPDLASRVDEVLYGA